MANRQTTKKVSSVGILFAVLISPISPLVQADTWKGKEVVRDGARHVVNPAEGIKPPKTVQLKELWRIGRVSEEEGEFFGLITGLVADRNGFVYILDYQLTEIKVFSPEGGHVRTIGRKGEGPGELRNPGSICISPNGLISVSMAYPSRFVQFSKQGDPAGLILMPEDTSGNTPIICDVFFAGDHWVIRGLNQGYVDQNEEQVYYLGAFDEKGNEMVRYYEEKYSSDLSNPVYEEKPRALIGRWAVGKDGKLYAASSFHDYEISVWHPNGELDFVIEKDYKPRKRSPEEKQLVYEWARSNPSGLWPGTEFKIEDYDKDIMALYLRDDGTCWVLTSRGFYDRPEGSVGVFDVFNRNGRFIQQMILMGRGDPFQDRYYFCGEYFYVVTSFIDAVVAMRGSNAKKGSFCSAEPEPMSVICYRIVPR